MLNLILGANGTSKNSLVRIEPIVEEDAFQRLVEFISSKPIPFVHTPAMQCEYATMMDMSSAIIRSTAFMTVGESFETLRSVPSVTFSFYRDVFGPEFLLVENLNLRIQSFTEFLTTNECVTPEHIKRQRMRSVLMSQSYIERNEDDAMLMRLICVGDRIRTPVDISEIDLDSYPLEFADTVEFSTVKNHYLNLDEH